MTVPEVQKYTTQDLAALAARIRDTDLIPTLTAQGIRLESYDENGSIQEGLTPYQKNCFDKLIQAALGGYAEIVWLLARQCGKTETVILSILTLAILQLTILRKGYSVGIFAPARSQTIDVDRARLRERTLQLSDFLKKNGIRHDNAFGRTVKLFNFYSGVHTFRCLMESADPEANIKGSTLNLIILEQAEDIDESKLKNDILPMGAAVAGSVVFSATPTAGINNQYLYDLATKRVVKEHLTRVDWIEASKWKPGYLEYVDLERERLGDDDPAFRAQYGLEWVPGLSKFTNMEDVLLHQSAYAWDPVYKRRVMGVDWAKAPDDTYAVVWEVCEEPTHADREGKVYRHLHLLAFHEEHGADFVDQCPRVVDFTKLWKVTRTCDDAVGKGDPVNEMLTRGLRGISSVEGLELTTTLNDNISNLFSREWFARRLWIPSAENFDKEPYLTLLRVEERVQQKRYLKKFVNQLLDLEREYKANKLNLHHPQGDYRDDAAKAAMYGVYAATGLLSSPPPAAYVTVDTKPERPQDELKEIARSFERPISEWWEI